MPYHIRKQPNDGYKVYGEDGTPHSKKGLPLARAKKQLIALNIAHAQKEGSMKYKRGGVITMAEPVYIREHKKLIKTLLEAQPKALKQEAKDQANEVYKKLGIKLL